MSNKRDNGYSMLKFAYHGFQWTKKYTGGIAGGMAYQDYKGRWTDSVTNQNW